MSEPEAIKLHRPAMATPLVRKAVAESPADYFPMGHACCQCKLLSYGFGEMWPIEFVYRLIGPDGRPHDTSIWLYACSEKHAAEFMLSFWDEGHQMGVPSIERI